MQATRSLILVVHLVLSLSLTACVSVRLSDSPTKKSDQYAFVTPRGDFEKLSMDTIDVGWRSKAHGNTISVVTDCSSSDDPPLESITRGVISGIERLEIKSEQEIEFNSRRALRTSAQGRVDGLPAEMDILAFKKNGCIYVIGHVALSKNFSKYNAEFANFLKGFKVP